MSDWHVGQLVICVRDWTVALDELPTMAIPIKDAIYTIRAIDPCLSGSKSLFLRFDEVVNPEREFSDGRYEPSFNSHGFRPVRKTSIEVFTAILNKTPELVEG